MPDINWGGDSSTAPFSSRLDEANGDLILAEDNSGGTVLLEYDGSTWQYRGPVELNGNDISGVGALTATDATVSGTVDAGAVNTGRVNSDYTAKPSDDINTIISGMSAGESIAIEGNHTISSSINPIDGITVHILGTVTLANSTDDYIINADSTNDVTITGPGAVDANKANQSVGNPALWIINTTDCTVRGLEVRNVLEGAAINGGTNSTRLHIVQNEVHDCGASSGSCDGIFQWASDSLIAFNEVRNITDAFIASDRCRDTRIIGNYCHNTSSYNTNVDTPQGGVSCYANSTTDWTGEIIGNTIKNTETSYGISDVADEGNRVEAVITNNRIVNAKQGIYLITSDSDFIVQSNTIKDATDGSIRCRAECEVLDNSIIGGGIGIWIQSGGGKSTLRDNKIANGTGTGVLVEAGLVTVSGNKIIPGGYGIYVNATTQDCRISNNRIENAGIYGIRATSGIDDSIVTGNHVTGSSQYGIRISGDKIIAKNNRAYNNSPDFDFSGLTNSVEKDNVSGT
jgi:parallel beta-helix repeat protein